MAVPQCKFFSRSRRPCRPADGSWNQMKLPTESHRVYLTGLHFKGISKNKLPSVDVLRLFRMLIRN